jgi:hypothetical protein
MSRTLPKQIVAVVEALAEDLAEWCRECRDRTLGAHEEAVLEEATSGLDVRLTQAREACTHCQVGRCRRMASRVVARSRRGAGR